MKKSIQIFLISFAVYAMSAFCGAGASDVDEVENVVKGIIAADNAGDLDKAISYYADDAVLIAPSGPDIVGKENIKMHYEALFAAYSLSIETEILETIVSGGWAVNRGVNHVISTARRTGQENAATSKYLMTLRKNDLSQWRIVHLIWANQPNEDASTPD